MKVQIRGKSKTSSIICRKTRNGGLQNLIYCDTNAKAKKVRDTYNNIVGLAGLSTSERDVRARLIKVQNRLFIIGGRYTTGNEKRDEDYTRKAYSVHGVRFFGILHYLDHGGTTPPTQEKGEPEHFMLTVCDYIVGHGYIDNDDAMLIMKAIREGVL